MAIKTAASSFTSSSRRQTIIFCILLLLGLCHGVESLLPHSGRSGRNMQQFQRSLGARNRACKSVPRGGGARTSPSASAGVANSGGAKDESGSTKKRFASALGYAVTLGACVTKVPQIKRCLTTGSVEGVSLSSNYLELSSLMSKVIYHRLNKYPFSTWAENVALIAQQMVIIALIWKMSVPAVMPTDIGIALAAQLVFVAGASSLPKKAWPLLLFVKSGMTILSGGAQIRLNFLNKSTGQLAWSPVALRVFGNTARVITTLVLAKKDYVLLSLYLISATLSLMLGTQFFIYR